MNREIRRRQTTRTHVEQRGPLAARPVDDDVRASPPSATPKIGPIAALTAALPPNTAAPELPPLRDRERRVLGFLGWALTDEALARSWLRDATSLRNEDRREGDSVIIDAWAADTRVANRFLLDSVRLRFADRRNVYFKRFCPDGRARAMRLAVPRWKAPLAPHDAANGAKL